MDDLVWKLLFLAGGAILLLVRPAIRRRAGRRKWTEMLPEAWPAQPASPVGDLAPETPETSAQPEPEPEPESRQQPSASVRTLRAASHASAAPASPPPAVPEPADGPDIDLRNADDVRRGIIWTEILHRKY